MKRTLLMVSIIAITIASCHATYRNLAHNSSYENALSTEKFVLNERVSARKVEIFVNPDSSFEVVSRLILSANSSVDIMIYEMWSMDFYDLIDNITQRGVRVRILFEGNTYSSAGDEWNRNMSAMLYELNLSGRPIWIRYETNSSSYLHAKMMIIDNYITIIGSENYLPTSYPENPSIITLQPYSTPSRGWGVVVFDSGFAQSCKNIFESIFLSDTKSMDYDFSLDVGSEPRNNGNEIYSV
ncbi:MAG: phospholipase D-like domain-containing protein, partial [Candidatus Njordarchaeota archaeon]